MGIPGQNICPVKWLFYSPRDLPSEDRIQVSLLLQVDSLGAESQREARRTIVGSYPFFQADLPKPQKSTYWGFGACRGILLSVELSGSPELRTY